MGLDLPWEGAGLKQGPGPSVGALEAEETVQGTEKHLRLRVKQLVCEHLNGMRNMETILAAAIQFPGEGCRDACPLGGAGLGAGAQGSWSDPGARSAVDCGEMLEGS